jgi:hypothetical protein
MCEMSEMNQYLNEMKNDIIQLYKNEMIDNEDDDFEDIIDDFKYGLRQTHLDWVKPIPNTIRSELREYCIERMEEEYDPDMYYSNMEIIDNEGVLSYCLVELILEDIDYD